MSTTPSTHTVLPSALETTAKTPRPENLVTSASPVRTAAAVLTDQTVAQPGVSKLYKDEAQLRPKVKAARANERDENATEDLVLSDAATPAQALAEGVGLEPALQSPAPMLLAQADGATSPGAGALPAPETAPSSTAAVPSSEATAPSANMGWLLGLAAIFAAGSGGGSKGSTPPASTATGYLIDSPVGGVDYYINGVLKGKTAADGSFAYSAGDVVTFKVVNITLGQLSPSSDGKVYVQDLAGVDRSNMTDAKMVKIAQLLQTLDADGNPANGIEVDPGKIATQAEQTITATTDLTALFTLGVAIVSESVAVSHLKPNNPDTSVLETTAPTATLELASTLLKAGGSTLVTLRFSEAVTLWDDINEMLTVTSGTLGTFSTTDGGLTYTGLYTAGAASAAQIRLSGNFSDLSGNAGEAAQTNVAVDLVLPTLTITDNKTSGAATGPVTYTFTFSEVVKDFTADDITVANGSKGTLVASTAEGEVGKVFTMTVTPPTGAEGSDLGLSVGTAWSDTTGNAPANTTVAQAQAYDTKAPTLTITDNKASGAATGPVTYTFTFSEVVKDFTAKDITVSNGSVGALVASTVEGEVGKVFTMVVTPPAGAEGADLGVSVGTAWSDTAGNAPANITVAQAQAYDTKTPTLTITDDKISGAATGPVTYTFTFSEVVKDFTADDITVANGSKGTLVASTVEGEVGKVFTMVVTPPTGTPVSVRSGISLAPAAPTPTTAGAEGADLGVSVGTAWSDMAGNAPANITVAEAQAYDTKAPTLTITDDKTSGAATGPVTYTFTFSEVVKGFTAKDITVANGSMGALVASTLEGEAGKVFTMTVTPPVGAEGSDIGLSVGTAWSDSAGNAPANITVAQVQAYDTKAPTLTITDNKASGAATGPVTYTFTFSEVVTNFTADDITVDHGSKGTFTATTIGENAGKVFTLVVTPPAGEQGVDLGVSVGTAWTDLAGNAAASSTIAEAQAYDIKPPTATLLPTLATVQLDAPANRILNPDSPARITALGSSGEFVMALVMTDENGNSVKSYIQKFNADGTPASAAPTELVVPRRAYPYADDTQAQITAVGHAGEFVVAWRGTNNDGDYSIFVQKFTANGGLATPGPVQLEAPNNYWVFNSMTPKVTALGTGGAYVVTWAGMDSAGYDHSIFVQKFDAEGSPSGTMVQLEAAGKTNGDDREPQITAVGSNGEFVVTWSGIDSQGDPSIFVQKFSADGSASGDPVQLEAPNKSNGSDFSTQIAAVGSSGEFVVTWMGQDSDSGADFSIFVQKFNADGITDGNTVQLEALNKANGTDQGPQITAVGSSGEFVVTWYGVDSQGDYSIFVQKFGASGSTSGSPVQLEALNKTNGSDEAPQITAVGNSGEFVVTWSGVDSQGDFSVFVQKFMANGHLATPGPVQLEALYKANGSDRMPDITAVGTAGEFVVSWYGVNSSGNNTESLFVQKFGADGLPITHSGVPVINASSQPGFTVPVQSSEAGTAYLVHSSINMSGGLSALTSGNDSMWNSVTVASANTQVDMPTTGLVDGSYTLYTADAAGNLSAGVSNALRIDTERPTLTISDNKASGATTGDVTYTFTFSKVVKDFTEDDINVANGSKGTLVASTAVGEVGKVFTMVVTPPEGEEGADLGVSVGKIWRDTAGNAPANSTIAEAQAYDSKAPTLTITDNKDEGAAKGAVTYTFAFSEVVKDFTADDITVTKGSKGPLVASTVEGEAGKVFTMVITPPSGEQGADLGVSVGTAWSDTVGNAPADSTSAGAQAYDRLAPTAKYLSAPLLTQLEALGVDNAYDSSAQISALGNGGAFVVTWWGEVQGYSHVFMQMFNASGTANGPTVQLEGSIDGTSPQITGLGTTGAFVVTWQGYDIFAGPNIFVQKFNANGTADGLAVQLGGVVPFSYDYDPQITALGDAGAFVVTWYGEDSGGDYTVFVQKFSADGTPSGGVASLEAWNTTSGYDERPQITALGQSGEFVVTWQGEESVADGGDKSIYVQKFNAAGGKATEQAIKLEAVNSPLGWDERPQIAALGSSGAFVVTWQCSDSEGDDSIFVQKFASDGTLQGSMVQLEALGVNDGYDSSPQIASVGTTGEFVVTWQGIDTSGHSSIFVRKFDADGNPQGDTVQLQADLTGSYAYPDNRDPQIISVGSTGEFVVTWQGTDREGDSSIFVQKFNANGSTSGGAVQLEALNKTNGYDTSVQITALGTAGEFAVTWEGQDSAGDNSIFVQKFGADGLPVGNGLAPVINASTNLAVFRVPVQSTEAGMAYLVHSSLDMSGGVVPLVNESYSKWTLATIATGNTTVNMTTYGLVDGSYTLYTTDAAGNLSAGVSNALVIDKTLPTLAITDNVIGTANGDVTYTFTFSEVVNDFTADDITVVQGSKGAFTATTVGESAGKVFTLVVTPTAGIESSDIGVFVGKAWSDTAGNAPASSSVAEAQAHDRKAPTLTITDNKDTGAAKGPVTYTFTFSEVVKDFTADDITVAKGSKGTLVPSTVEGEAGKVFTLVVTPPAGEEGADLGVSVGAAWSDLLGNAPADPMVAPAQAYDSKAPNLTITDNKDAGAATGPVTYTFSFSEVIKDFTADDITVSKGSKGTLVASTVEGEVGKVFTMAITPPEGEEGADLGLSVGKVWSDTAGNAPANITVAETQAYDAKAPTLTIIDNKISGAATGPVTYTFTFSEVVKDFSADDITVAKGSKGALVPSTVEGEAGKVFTMVVTPPAGEEGADLGVSVGSAWSDTAGNAPANSTIAEAQAYDAKAPSAKLATAPFMTQLEAAGSVTSGYHGSPQIAAVGSTGEFVVTWYGSDTEGDYSIFVQKFNADGVKATDEPVQLEGLNKANGSDYYPQVTAVGNAGEFVVTWFGADDSANGDYSIFVQKFNANGSKATAAPVQLEALNRTNGYDFSPQITAVGSAGEFVVAFYGEDTGFDNSIFVQKFNADGTIQGDMVQLEALNKSNGSDESPQITALGRTGEYVVTFSGIDSQGDRSIFVQKFNATGTTQGGMVQLEALNRDNGRDQIPQITALGNTGEYVVTWEGQDADTPSNSSIFVQKFNADGSKASSAPVQLEALNVTLGADERSQITPVGSMGEFVVTWQGEDVNGDNSIFVQKFNTNGTPQGDMVQLEALQNMYGDDKRPQIVALGSAGEFVVTWSGADGTEGDDSIFVQKFGADGSTLGNSVKLETPSNLNGIDQYPQITAMGSAGEFVVTWEGVDANWNFKVFVQKFTADGSPVTSAGPVINAYTQNPDGVTVPVQSTEAGMAYLVHSSINMAAGVSALTPLNEALWNSQTIATANTTVDIATTGLADGEYRLYTADASGNLSQAVNKALVIDKVLPTLTITDNQISGAATGPVTYTFTFSEEVKDFTADDITVANGSKGALVASTAEGEVGKVFTMVVTPPAGAEGADIGLRVGMPHEGTWSDLAGNTPDRYAAFADAQAYDTLAPTVKLLTAPHMTQLEALGVSNAYDGSAQISAIGNAGEFVVTWVGEKDTINRVFMQKFNASGTANGPTVELEGSIFGSSPQITSLGTAGAFVVTWQGYDIFAGPNVFVQKFNAAGTADGLAVQLGGVVSSSYDYAPQITALGDAGAFVVTWYGEDSGGDYTVFVQKFSADGSPSGGVASLEALNTTSGYDERPQITSLGQSGEFVVTWQGEESAADGGDKSIYVQKFKADGSKATELPLKLEASDNATGWDEQPQIAALGGSGAFVVTWQCSDSDGDDSIYVQKFGADGMFLGNTVKLEAWGVQDGYDREPQIASVGSSGEFVVTWNGQDTEGYYKIFVQKFGLDGAPQGNTVQLQADLSGNSTYVENRTPQITALGSTGEFVVTWEAADSNGDNSIFVQKFASDASTLGSQVQLEALNKADDYDASVQITALGTAGEFAVTWEGVDSNGDNSIFVQKFNADGSVAKAAVTGAAGDVTVPITSSEVGMAYLVHNSIDLSALGLGALTANNDALWNSMAVAQANTQVDISTAGLDAGSYNLFTADAAGNWAVTLGVFNASLQNTII
jgi:large repetitive protein